MAPALLLQTLSRSALRSSTSSWLCRQCLSKLTSAHSRTFSATTKRLTTSSKSSPILSSALQQKTTPLELLGQQLGSKSILSTRKLLAARAKSGPFFPETSEKVVGYWLLGSAGLVFSIVVLGGLTRLTESGLSITEWKPVTGSLPPLSAADWEENFSKYRDSPEYRLLNPHMTLSEYKFIYYMEWSHRLLGRFIGLSFVLPGVYFIARRKVSAQVARRITGIALLIGFQGFLGWWMVKSGLQDDLFAEPGSHPRVSQYRLTAHLGAAFTVYSAMLWTGYQVVRTQNLLKNPENALKVCKSLTAPQLRVMRSLVGVVTLLVFSTAMIGGMVAGLDAGLVYNEYPKMGLGYHPPHKELLDPHYSRASDQSDILWRNLLENPVAVQFEHRTMAHTTFAAILGVFAYSRLSSKMVQHLPKNVKAGIMGVLHLAIMQVLLGIGTLIYMVPTPLAAAHQAGSLALLSGLIITGGRMAVPRGVESAARGLIKARAEVVRRGRV